MSGTRRAENGKYRVAKRGLADEDVHDTRNRHVAAHQQRARLRRIKTVLAKRAADPNMEADVIRAEMSRDLRLLAESGAPHLPDITDDVQLEQLLRDELESHESVHGEVDGLVDGDLDGNVHVAMDVSYEEEDTFCDEEQYGDETEDERLIREAEDMEARDIEHLVHQMSLNQ